MSRILVVDDEQSMREMLAIMLRKEGYEIVTADGRGQAAAVLGNETIHMVITDVKLRDGDGIEILRHVKAASPETIVIVMTAFGTTEIAIAARKLGAEAYVLKPFDVDELRIVVRDAFANSRLREENVILKREVGQLHGLDHVVGTSAVMAALFEMVRAVAPTSSTILVTGESGTGKELVARAIHGLSGRAERPFVSINCGALPDTLLESELFGHVKGAFTDARQNKKGLFEAAHGGTLFLDEVGETSPPMQVKLLRALQERRIRRLGGTEETDVDVRVIAATNTPLEDLVRERALSRGSVLSASGDPHPHASTAGATRGHPSPGRALPREVQPPDGEERGSTHGGGSRQPRALRLAGQRAGARERHRACGGAGDLHRGGTGAAAGGTSRGEARGVGASHRPRFQPRHTPQGGRGPAPRRGPGDGRGGPGRGGPAPRHLPPLPPLSGAEACRFE